MRIPALRFSKWMAWTERGTLPHIDSPGVYAVCVSKTLRAGTPFAWHRDICYFGMTNSKGGLRARLRQFDRTLRASTAHGGADRFRFVHSSYSAILPQLYVAILPVPAHVEKPAPRDLRAMGAVAWFEYECLARYQTRFGQLPQFNQRTAPKQSKTARHR